MKIPAYELIGIIFLLVVTATACDSPEVTDSRNNFENKNEQNNLESSDAAKEEEKKQGGTGDGSSSNVDVSKQLKLTVPFGLHVQSGIYDVKVAGDRDFDAFSFSLLSKIDFKNLDCNKNTVSSDAPRYLAGTNLSLNIENRADGEYALCVYIFKNGLKDYAEVLKYSFTIDNKAPSILIDEFKKLVNSSFIVEIASDETAEVEWHVTGQMSTVSVKKISDKSYEFSPGIDGEYTAKVKLTDLAGNSREQEFLFEYDTTAPNILNTSEYQVSSGDTYVVLTDDQITRDAKIVAPEGVTAHSPESNNSFILTGEDGHYELTLSISDQAGNLSTKTVMLRINSTTPKINLNSGLPYNHNFLVPSRLLSMSQYKNATHSTAFNGINFTSVEWEKIAGADVLFDDSSTFYPNITFSSDGSYTLRITIADGDGDKDSKDIKFFVDSTRPTVALKSIRDEAKPFGADSSAFFGLRLVSPEVIGGGNYYGSNELKVMVDGEEVGVEAIMHNYSEPLDQLPTGQQGKMSIVFDKMLPAGRDVNVSISGLVDKLGNKMNTASTVVNLSGPSLSTVPDVSLPSDCLVGRGFSSVDRVLEFEETNSGLAVLLKTKCLTRQYVSNTRWPGYYGVDTYFMSYYDGSTWAHKLISGSEKIVLHGGSIYVLYNIDTSYYPDVAVKLEKFSFSNGEFNKTSEVVLDDIGLSNFFYSSDKVDKVVSLYNGGYSVIDLEKMTSKWVAKPAGETPAPGGGSALYSIRDGQFYGSFVSNSDEIRNHIVIDLNQPLSQMSALRPTITNADVIVKNGANLESFKHSFEKEESGYYIRYKLNVESSLNGSQLQPKWNHKLLRYDRGSDEFADCYSKNGSKGEYLFFCRYPKPFYLLYSGSKFVPVYVNTGYRNRSISRVIPYFYEHYKVLGPQQIDVSSSILDQDLSTIYYHNPANGKLVTFTKYGGITEIPISGQVCKVSGNNQVFCIDGRTVKVWK